jgi:hypothetical protein
LEKGEVLAYAEEVCSKVEPVGIQQVEVAEQEVLGTYPWWLEHLRPGSSHTTAQTHIVSG